MEEPNICVKILCPSIRCIFITKYSKWQITLKRCQEFSLEEELYLEGNFRPTIADVLKAEIVKDKNSIEAYRYLFGHHDWIGLDFMYLIELSLKILEANDELPEGPITEFPKVKVSKTIKSQSNP
jgi:hypothetical protein